MPEAAIAHVRCGRADVSGNPPLPGVLAEIAEAAGREAAIKIALEWGGREIHIPKPAYLRGRGTHRLVALLGSRTASAVAARVGGGSTYIPRARRACAAFLATDHSPAEIAGRLGVSPKVARRYSRRA